MYSTLMSGRVVTGYSGQWWDADSHLWCIYHWCQVELYLTIVANEGMLFMYIPLTSSRVVPDYSGQWSEVRHNTEFTLKLVLIRPILAVMRSWKHTISTRLPRIFTIVVFYSATMDSSRRGYPFKIIKWPFVSFCHRFAPFGPACSTLTAYLNSLSAIFNKTNFLPNEFKCKPIDSNLRNISYTSSMRLHFTYYSLVIYNNYVWFHVCFVTKSCR